MDEQADAGGGKVASEVMPEIEAKLVGLPAIARALLDVATLSAFLVDIVCLAKAHWIQVLPFASIDTSCDRRCMQAGAQVCQVSASFRKIAQVYRNLRKFAKVSKTLQKLVNPWEHLRDKRKLAKFSEILQTLHKCATACNSLQQLAESCKNLKLEVS